jgi:AcrR family transcriptional regulator
MTKRLGPPTGRRAENAADTKARLLTVAVDHFSRQGFAGARTDAIAKDANVGNRMIYHYFGDKEGLYIASLDRVLGALREEELTVDVKEMQPLEGLLQLFDFTYRHFSQHPELIRLLSAENLLEAKYLKRSVETHSRASPVIQGIAYLIERGEASGSIRKGIDPLHFYVVIVGLSYFHISNAHTLGVIWKTDLTTDDWKKEHYEIATEMLRRFLAPS